MIKTNLFTGEEAREKLMSGILKAANAVAVTMGTSGANSVIEALENPGHFVTNDGATILSRIHFEDPLEEMGRKILLESVGRANKASGDGSSTATVLTASILSEGIKYIGKLAPMDIKRSLEDCLPIIEASLASQKKNITMDTVEAVASISAEDSSIGSMIQKIYQEIGKEGIINWEASKVPEDSYVIGTGIKISGATYTSRYMCDFVNGEYTNKATLENPYIFLAKSKITSQGEMEKFIGEMQQKEIKELVIFCDEMDASILNSFILARAPQTLGMRFLIIKMPVIWNDQWWEDLEKATGGRIISKSSGIKISDMKVDFLGRVGKITVDKEDTFIDGIADLTKHILALKVENTDESLQRAARLNTKTARYLVGAHSESALAYRRLKVEDAIASAAGALEYGILPGGGVALFNASNMLPDSVGGNILEKAMKAPLLQIIKNTGKTDIELKTDKPTYGFDSKTGEIVDMFEAGIVDAYDVVKNAINSAIGVAAGILTVGTVVLYPRREDSLEDIIKNMVK